MYYLVQVNDSFSVFLDRTYVPEQLQDQIIEVESLPGGSGTLRRKEDGTFYYDTLQNDVVEEPTPTPEEPTPKPEPESIEDKLTRMEAQMDSQNAQTLMVIDINLSLYEEILSLREEVASLKGI